jgi:hypothetical protein
MKPLLALAATGLLLVGGSAPAQSARDTVRLPELLLLPDVSTPTANQTASGEWKDLLHTTLTTGQKKNFALQVSLEAGLHTHEPPRGPPATADGGPARGLLELRVLVDGSPVAPGAVTLTERPRHLLTRLGEVLRSCADTDANGTLVLDECVLTGEEQRRVLRSLGDHALSFALDDIAPGTHELRIQARVSVSTQGATGSVSAGAWIGRGSFSLEEVRLVKRFDI